MWDNKKRTYFLLTMLTENKKKKERKTPGDIILFLRTKHINDLMIYDDMI